MSPPRATPRSYETARKLRKEFTPAESRLWHYLRGDKLNGIHFRRQHPIGNYITDFCAPSVKIVIELDGSQHLNHEVYDQSRTEFLNKLGYKVIRFWNDQVMKDINGVLQAILYAIKD